MIPFQNQKHLENSLKLSVVAAFPRCDACRSSRKESVLMSGVLPDFFIDHLLVSLAAQWLFLTADNAKEEDDEEEEQAARQHQTDNHYEKNPQNINQHPLVVLLSSSMLKRYLDFVWVTGTPCCDRLRWTVL